MSSNFIDARKKKHNGNKLDLDGADCVEDFTIPNYRKRDVKNTPARFSRCVCNIAARNITPPIIKNQMHSSFVREMASSGSFNDNAWRKSIGCNEWFGALAFHVHEWSKNWKVIRINYPIKFSKENGEYRKWGSNEDGR